MPRNAADRVFQRSAKGGERTPPKKSFGKRGAGGEPHFFEKRFSPGNLLSFFSSPCSFPLGRSPAKGGGVSQAEAPGALVGALAADPVAVAVGPGPVPGKGKVRLWPEGPSQVRVPDEKLLGARVPTEPHARKGVPPVSGDAEPTSAIPRIRAHARREKWIPLDIESLSMAKAEKRDGSGGKFSPLSLFWSSLSGFQGGKTARPKNSPMPRLSAKARRIGVLDRVFPINPVGRGLFQGP